MASGRFDAMSTAQLEAWIKRVTREWEALPAALAELATRDGGMSYGEMSRRLGMHKATVHRRVLRSNG